MNILSQNLKNLLQNKLKDILNNFSSQIIDSAIESLIDNDSNKYFSLISSFHEKEKELICNVIKETLESTDLCFRNSLDRKRLYNINKSNVPRTLTTIFGDITFYRTYYESKLDDSLHFVLDEALGLPKNDKYDTIVKGKAISLYSKTNLNIAGEIIGEELTSIKNLSNNESINKIPRQSIYNWIKEWNTPKVEFKERETPSILYVMADEKFIGCQNQDGDIMIKSFVAFEGVESTSKGRRKLKNKIIINMISKRPWEDFSNILFKVYDPQKIEKIYLLGDGANWIKSGLTELKVEENMNIKHLLCEFHFKQAINNITVDEDEREILNLSFIQDTKNEFNKYIEEIKENNKPKEKTITKKQAYILNNYNAIKDCIEADIGSSMESHISHYVANQFGSRPKGYSSERIDNYIGISNLKNNNFNIFNTYLMTYKNNEIISINEDKINFSIFNQNNNFNINNYSYQKNDEIFTIKQILNGGYNI